MAKHIKKSERARGRSLKTAKRTAYATVNKYRAAHGLTKGGKMRMRARRRRNPTADPLASLKAQMGGHPLLKGRKARKRRPLSRTRKGTSKEYGPATSAVASLMAQKRRHLAALKGVRKRKRKGSKRRQRSSSGQFMSTVKRKGKGRKTMAKKRRYRRHRKGAYRAKGGLRVLSVRRRKRTGMRTAVVKRRRSRRKIRLHSVRRSHSRKRRWRRYSGHWKARGRRHRMRAKILSNPRKHRRRRRGVKRVHHRRRRNPMGDGSLMNTVKAIAVAVVPATLSFYVGRLVAKKLSGVIGGLSFMQSHGNLEKAVDPIASVAVLAGVWYLTKKVGVAAKYGPSLMVGVGINALTSILNAVAPSVLAPFGADELIGPVGGYNEDNRLTGTGEYVHTGEYVQTSGEGEYMIAHPQAAHLLAPSPAGSSSTGAGDDDDGLGMLAAAVESGEVYGGIFKAGRGIGSI